jgi:hypothetical protein
MVADPLAEPRNRLLGGELLQVRRLCRRIDRGRHADDRGVHGVRRQRGRDEDALADQLFEDLGDAGLEDVRPARERQSRADDADPGEFYRFHC